jgi:hypothetical protein
MLPSDTHHSKPEPSQLRGSHGTHVPHHPVPTGQFKYSHARTYTNDTRTHARHTKDTHTHTHDMDPIKNIHHPSATVAGILRRTGKTALTVLPRTRRTHMTNSRKSISPDLSVSAARRYPKRRARAREEKHSACLSTCACLSTWMTQLHAAHALTSTPLPQPTTQPPAPHRTKKGKHSCGELGALDASEVRIKLVH